MNSRSLTARLALAALIAPAVLVAATASAAPRQAVVYDALGDSYASGFGVPPYQACGRSEAAYAVRLDARRKIDLDDFVAMATRRTQPPSPLRSTPRGRGRPGSGRVLVTPQNAHHRYANARRIIMRMNAPVIDREVLANELRRVGHVDVDIFMEVLRRSVRTTVAVPSEARALMERAGVDTRLLDPDVIDEARLEIAARTAGSLEAAFKGSISTKEAATLLGTRDSNIRRGVAANRIYSAGRTTGGHRLPEWQFVGGKPLPHMAEVLDSLPSDLHPLEVESFFTSPDESLNGMAPAGWLATGGRVEPVVALAEAEARR